MKGTHLMKTYRAFCRQRRYQIAIHFFIISVFFLGAILQAAVSGLDEFGHLQATATSGNDDFSCTRLENGVQLNIDGVTKNVLFYGPSTIRVNENLGRSYWTHPSIVVVGKPAAVPFKVQEAADTVAIVSDKLQIKVDKKTGALTFMDTAGKVLTKERAGNHATIKQVEISGAPTYEVSNTFTLKPDEGWYGFGYIDSAPTQINRRRQELLLIQTNMGIVIPMIVSSERYGIMWDTYSIMRFKDDATGATLWAESAPGGVDYYFFAGDTMDDVIIALAYYGVRPEQILNELERREGVSGLAEKAARPNT